MDDSIECSESLLGIHTNCISLCLTAFKWYFFLVGGRKQHKKLTEQQSKCLWIQWNSKNTGKDSVRN